MSTILTSVTPLGGGASSRSSVRGLGRMDFNQGTSFTLAAHNSYTFNQDGYVIIVELTNSSTRDTSYLSINNKTIVACISPDVISCWFPICANDIISKSGYNSSRFNCLFVPEKQD